MARPEVREITFEIDGREVRAPEGTMLVDAAKHGDVEIPYFCYERKLGQPVGACRMCLVEIEGMPKLQTSCSTPVKDGMVVNTTSDRVKAAQDAVVEFLLVNHPLDCPVCDKGGECPLQDISYGWGGGRSRFIEPKRHFRKPLELSPLVAIDRERCILCYRCVRFSQEVAEDYQLVFLERGDHTYVGTHDGRPYVAPFSGNIVELCPVGALTSTAYRFRARPWDIEGAGSICTLCPSQCNVTFTVRDDAKVAARARAREPRGRRRLAVRQGPLRLPGHPRARSACARRWCATAARCARSRGSARSDEAAAALAKAGAEGRGAGGRGDHQRGGASSLQHLMRKGLGSPHLDSRAGGALDAEQARVLARPDLSARVSDIDHAGRGAGGGDRAGGRGADPRPARAQGGAAQRHEGRDAHQPAEHARPQRRRAVRFAPGAAEAALARRARRRAGARRPSWPRARSPGRPGPDDGAHARGHADARDERTRRRGRRRRRCLRGAPATVVVICGASASPTATAAQAVDALLAVAGALGVADTRRSRA